MKSLLSALVLLLFSVSSAQAQADAPWPNESWPRSTLEQAGFNKHKFNEFLKRVFFPQLTFQTDGIVVIKDGQLVFEDYANGYDRDRKHALFSLGKSMISAVVGVMEQEGLLRRDDFVSRYFPMVDHGGRRSITLRHLLNMSSGLEWIEEDRENLLTSDPWFAFYSRASYLDMASWIAKRPNAHPPGAKFNYSSGDSGLLMAVIRGALGDNRYQNYLWEKLFRPLGMNSVAIQRDVAGNIALHGMGFATPLDVAKLGLLYLRDGQVNGQRLWPADWLKFTNEMAPAQKNASDPKDRNLQNNQAYGAQIWLNRARPEDRERPYPELPENALMGLGTRGQILLILPDENLVLVRTGTDTEPSLKERKNYRHEIFKLFIASLARKGRS